LLFLVGCKTKHTISEKTITKTDSTAIWNLNDSLYKKETQIAILKSDLQRLSDENTRLLNETSMHQISYDTSAPVNPQTGKPPIASESFTISKSTLEETKKEYKTLLQSASLETEYLSRQNQSLQFTVEKLTNENKQLTEKTSSSTPLKLKLFIISFFIGFFLCQFIYIFVKNR
jgi:regulator of replication initiation timing